MVDSLKVAGWTRVLGRRHEERVSRIDV